MMMRSLGVFGYQQDQMLSVYVAYGLNVGAFFSETFRSAIQSVPAGQKEAALSIGQTKWEVNRRIVLPQAIRIAIPSIGAQIVGLLQNTSLAFSIGIIDMIGKVRSLAAIARRSLEGYIAAAIIFVILSILLEQLFTYIEKKTAYGSQKPNLKVKTNVLSNN